MRVPVLPQAQNPLTHKQQRLLKKRAAPVQPLPSVAQPSPAPQQGGESGDAALKDLEDFDKDDSENPASIDKRVEVEAEKMSAEDDKREGQGYVDQLLKHPHRTALARADAKNGESIAAFLRHEAAALQKQGTAKVPSIPRILHREVAEEAIAAQVTTTTVASVAALGTRQVRPTQAQIPPAEEDAAGGNAGAGVGEEPEEEPAELHDVLGTTLRGQASAKPAAVGKPAEGEGDLALKTLIGNADDEEAESGGDQEELLSTDLLVHEIMA